MGLFNNILEKLGLRKEKEEEKPAAKPADSAPKKPTDMTFTPTHPGGATAKPAAQQQAEKPKVAAPAPSQPAAAPATATAAATAPKPVSEVDVTKMLEQKAKGTGLNWKQSISDLLFLLDIDNSYQARVELAKELNAPQEVMGDSARMNTWLHKTVLKKIAENGGNIPQDLLD